MNTQAVEKVKHDQYGLYLDVHSIFLTIQGEGPYAGEPAVFIRLAGCILQCPLCDTDYTSGRKTVGIREIVEEVRSLTFGKEITLVVITGGEPLRQSCGPLVRTLHDAGYDVQIETNGMVNDRTLTEETAISDFSIVCSPKGKIHEELYSHIVALKYVLKADDIDAKDGLPKRMLDLPTRPDRPWAGYTGAIFVQPCDEGNIEKNKRNMDAAIKSCLEFGYTLSLQLHKLCGLP